MNEKEISTRVAEGGLIYLVLTPLSLQNLDLTGEIGFSIDSILSRTANRFGHFAKRRKEVSGTLRENIVELQFFIVGLGEY